MAAVLPYRNNEVHSYWPWVRPDGVPAAADYTTIADGGPNSDDLTVTFSQWHRPLIVGGRRHSLGVEHVNHAFDTAWEFWDVINSDSHHAATSGTASAASRAAAVANNYSVMFWMRKASTNGASTSTPVALSGDNTNTSAENALFSISVNGDVQVFWETGAGVDDSVTWTGSGASITEDGQTWHHIAVVRTPNGPNWDYELYIDGASEGVQTATALPDGGANARWCFGKRWYNVVNEHEFYGSIQDVATFDTNLSAADVAAFAVVADDFDTVATARSLTANVENHWACDEAPDFYDHGPMGRHAGLVLNPGVFVPRDLDEGWFASMDPSASAARTLAVAPGHWGELVETAPWTLVWWGVPQLDPDINSRTLLRWGGSGDDGPGHTNVALVVTMMADDRLDVFWEHSGGTDVNLAGSAAVNWAANTVMMIAVIVSDAGGGNVDIDVWVNGSVIESFTGQVPPGWGGNLRSGLTRFDLMGQWQSNFGEPWAALNGTLALYSVALDDTTLDGYYTAAQNAWPVGTGTGDLTPPTVSLVSPSNGATISRTTPIVVDVEDETQLSRVRLLLRYVGDAAATEIYDGTQFRGDLVKSTVQDLDGDGGRLRFTLQSVGGWKRDIGALRVEASDGNVEVLL